MVFYDIENADVKLQLMCSRDTYEKSSSSADGTFSFEELHHLLSVGDVIGKLSSFICAEIEPPVLPSILATVSIFYRPFLLPFLFIYIYI